jgi:pyruvate carboxylase
MIVAAIAALAAAPEGARVWKAADFTAMGKNLAGKVNAQKFANEQIGNYGNHSLLVTHRLASGEAEVHDTQVDVFIVQDGTATLAYGGTVVKPRTTGPGETRGASIMRMRQALNELRIEGVGTNINFLKHLINRKEFIEMSCHTSWVEKEVLPGYAEEPYAVPV